MEIPFSRWYSVIQTRRSRRRFDPTRPIESTILATLDKTCRNFRPFSFARAILVNEPKEDVFKGIVGGYGKVTGAPAFIAFIGDMRGASVQEELGYLGEGIILEATALGLNTCWVGGYFKPETAASLIEIGPDERVLAVSPVGYSNETETFEEKTMTGFGKSHLRLPLSEIAVNWNDTSLPQWTRVAIEAARLAPSAVNRQPWLFGPQKDGILVSVKPEARGASVSPRLDCGIAMLHIEIAAGNLGVKGNWKFLESPEVAKFTVNPG